MTLDKTEKMNAYLDFYGMLLTEKQYSALDYYYHENYSYSEIADLENTSRAAVYDLIKRSEALLEDYESKMHLYQNYEKRNAIYGKLLALNIKEVTQLVTECMDTE